MIDENILRFEIAVQDPFGVDVCHSTEDLFEDDLDLFLLDFVILVGEEFLEVVVVVVEYYFEQLLLGLVDDLVERDYVGVLLESLQERDLSERTGGNSLLLSFEFDVLDGDQFVILIHGLVDFSEGSLSDRTDLGVPITFFHF